MLAALSPLSVVISPHPMASNGISPETFLGNAI